MLRAALVTALMLFAQVFVGCPMEEPIMGDWISESDISGNHNELEVDDFLQGEGTLFGVSNDTLYEFTYEFTVTITGDSLYELEMEADEDSALDFTMDCEMDAAHDDMDCSGDELWSDYAFEWEKD